MMGMLGKMRRKTRALDKIELRTITSERVEVTLSIEKIIESRLRWFGYVWEVAQCLNRVD